MSKGVKTYKYFK